MVFRDEPDTSWVENRPLVLNSQFPKLLLLTACGAVLVSCSSQLIALFCSRYLLVIL